MLFNINLVLRRIVWIGCRIRIPRMLNAKKILDKRPHVNRPFKNDFPFARFVAILAIVA